MNRQDTESGYSLLEVMISMVVLGIAFMALIATQLGTLNGYVSARDEMEASEVGRRTTDILRAQTSQWVGKTGAFSAAADPYDAGGNTPFDVANPAGAILGAAGNWIALYDLPVDVRLNRAIASISADHLGGKFCVYARGDNVAPYTAFLTGAPTVAAMKVQVAVVYPGPNAFLTDCTLGTQIQPADLDDVGDPTADPFVPPPLESQGLRVSYFGTMLVRNAHLGN